MEHQIKAILKQRGLTQKELAERLEMSIQQLNNTISGRNTASMAVYERIADALGVDFWQLFAPGDVLDRINQPADPSARCPYCGHEINIKIE